jgi:hypothetical protein
MSSVDELFDRYRAAFRNGDDPDPRPFLAQVSGTDRRELEALIEAFLTRAPAPAFDLARAQADPITRRVVESLMADQETWRTLLPAARDAAAITRDQLVDQLAAALGVESRRDKVQRRYHEMEQGLLAPQGVSDRVLEALSRIVGVSVERLQAAGRRLAPPPAAGAAPAVFARAAPMPAPAAAPKATRRAAREPGERDEVDELFLGSEPRPR